MKQQIFIKMVIWMVGFAMGTAFAFSYVLLTQ